MRAEQRVAWDSLLAHVRVPMNSEFLTGFRWLRDRAIAAARRVAKRVPPSLCHSCLGGPSSWPASCGRGVHPSGNNAERPGRELCLEVEDVTDRIASH
ncbi:MAG: hypothetical protein ACI9OJ_001910 [Myxococcota bacterium]